MAAGPFTVLSAAIEAIAKGLIDLDGATFVITLHAGTYVPANDADAIWAHVSASEMTGFGYTTGGKPLTGAAVTRSAGSVRFLVDSVEWQNTTLQDIKYAVVTQRAGAALASSDLLLGYVELEAGDMVSTRNGSLTINWNAAGLFTLSRSA